MATRRKPAKPRPRRRQTAEEELAAEELALAQEIERWSKEDQAALAAGFDKFLKQLGIRGKPIGAKKLQERLLKRGFDPNTNEFSREIIAMREE
jgi:hypothetical protein